MSPLSRIGFYDPCLATNNMAFASSTVLMMCAGRNVEQRRERRDPPLDPAARWSRDRMNLAGTEVPDPGPPKARQCVLSPAFDAREQD